MQSGEMVGAVVGRISRGQIMEDLVDHIVGFMGVLEELKVRK